MLPEHCTQTKATLAERHVLLWWFIHCVSDKLVAHAVTADVLTTPCRAHLLLSLPLPVTVCVYHHSLAVPGVFNGWAFSSSGFFIGTAASTTQALKSSCPGFGAFSVDIRYSLTTAVHQKALAALEICLCSGKGSQLWEPGATWSLNWVCSLLLLC